MQINHNSTQFRQEAEAYARGQLLAFTALAKMHFSTGLPGDFGSNSAKIKLDWAEHRVRSRASNRLISISMRRRCVGDVIAPEYPHYADDPVIGDIYCPTWQTRLLVCLGHEFSHVVQCHIRVGAIAQYDREGHGWLFQKVYRVFRREYINPIIAKETAIKETEHA
jgi:hypothetical protein